MKFVPPNVNFNMISCVFLHLELFLAEIPATSFMGSEISQANMGRQKMT